MPFNLQNFIIKRNDTLPALTVSIKRRGELDDLLPFNLTNVTGMTFSMEDANNNLKISSASAQTISITGGTIQYNWTPSDTDTDGRYLGEFELFFADGNKMSVPTLGGIVIEIVKDVNML